MVERLRLASLGRKPAAGGARGSGPNPCYSLSHVSTVGAAASSQPEQWVHAAVDFQHRAADIDESASKPMPSD
jgi:hypothetical protein